MEYINKIKEFSLEILNELGCGYKENIYVNAMCIHLRNNNYLFNTEVIVPINYKGIQLGYERADIVIYEPFKCIIEFKSQVNNLTKKELLQLDKYKKNLNIENGILINFNTNNKLEFKFNEHEKTNNTIVINS